MSDETANTTPLQSHPPQDATDTSNTTDKAPIVVDDVPSESLLDGCKSPYETKLILNSDSAREERSSTQSQVLDDPTPPATLLTKRGVPMRKSALEVAEKVSAIRKWERMSEKSEIFKKIADEINAEIEREKSLKKTKTAQPDSEDEATIDDDYDSFEDSSTSEENSDEKDEYLHSSNEDEESSDEDTLDEELSDENTLDEESSNKDTLDEEFLDEDSLSEEFSEEMDVEEIKQ